MPVFNSHISNLPKNKTVFDSHLIHATTYAPWAQRCARQPRKPNITKNLLFWPICELSNSTEMNGHPGSWHHPGSWRFGLPTSMVTADSDHLARPWAAALHTLWNVSSAVRVRQKGIHTFTLSLLCSLSEEKGQIEIMEERSIFPALVFQLKASGKRQRLCYIFSCRALCFFCFLFSC